MVESFKITAVKLKRILKISVNLPKSYHKSENLYPLLICFDGQLLYNFINEDTKKINIAQILDNHDKECICISLQSPKLEAWRMSELNPYYNGDDETVDTVLSYIYFEYITNELLPLLKTRYRFNDDIYLLGFDEGAIASLFMVYKYNMIKGAGLFHPRLDLCDTKLSSDLDKNFKANKIMYLYQGGANTSSQEDTMFYNLYTRLESLKCSQLLLDFDSNDSNNYADYEKHLKNFIKFILP